ncbi:MAG: hypothetical protein U0935_10770 [Pirellulales bacterium]
MPQGEQGGAVRSRTGAGWLLVLALVVVCGVAPLRAAERPAPVYTRDTAFTIPFSIDAGATDLVEVQLLTSLDRGTTWHLYARLGPGEKGFRFRAPRDGEYWFASRTLDRQGQTRPGGQPEPQLIVVVDTVLPRMQLQATAGAAGEIHVRCEVTDERVDPQSFQLFYLAGVAGTQQPVAVSPLTPGPTANTYLGQVTFWPQGGGRLAQLSAEVKDAAGNRAVASKRVYLPAAPRGRTPPPFLPPNATATQPPPYQGPNVAPPAAAMATAAPPGTPPTPATASGPGANSGSVPPGVPTGVPPYQPPGMAGAAAVASPGRLVASSQPASPPSAVGGSGSEVPNPATATTATSGPPTTPLGGDLPGGERPRMTNSKKFALEYDIDSAGPGGVSDVELWQTRDRGATWTRQATDEDRRSPFDVQVDSEGVFGFRIVIVSKSGLASSSPRSGDPADLWVGVDCSPPQVQLTSVSFAEGEEAGKLDIRWEANDMRLGARPITLLYAEKDSGPWTTIAAGLPNNGQYYWSVAGQIPPRALLRIEARDEAGNLGSYQTLDPINLQGLNPAGRIRGFTPASPPPSGATRQPLFGTRRR